VILEPSSESFLQIKAIAFQIHMRFPCSVGGSGPHDFAVRDARFVVAHLTSTAARAYVRDDRDTPLVSQTCARMSERAVLAKPPVAGTEPVTPQRQ
jgi:hypothetical protein